MVRRSFLSYAIDIIHLQQLVNSHSWLYMNAGTLNKARTEAPDRDRIRCQSQPQLNSRAALSVQEQRQLYILATKA